MLMVYVLLCLTDHIFLSVNTCCTAILKQRYVFLRTKSW